MGDERRFQFDWRYVTALSCGGLLLLSALHEVLQGNQEESIVELVGGGVLTSVAALRIFLPQIADLRLFGRDPNLSRTPLEAAIARHEGDWPWEFHRHVMETTTLTESDRGLFASAWIEASQEIYWISSDRPRSGAERAEQALKDRFPQLSPAAIRAIVNAASYQWR